jgi:solute carrier family 26 (sodium-independent sulfate anion transporter), member 11
LAYSGIAGLPAAYGLYGAFLGCFIYIFLGSCKEISMGPTAIASLLTFQVTQGVWQRAVLASFLCGIIQILMGLFGLGFLVDFVSGPVSSGFTSAVAIIILTSQVKDVLGISAAGGTFVNMWSSIFENIGDTRMGDTILGLCSIIVLLFMRLLPNVKIGPADDDQRTPFQKFFNKTMWMIGTSRNAIIIIVTGGIASITYNNGHDYFKLIGE